MLNIFKKLRVILSRRDKEFLAFLLMFSVAVSAVEVVGVGIIMPFIGVATNFNNIFSNKYLKGVYNIFGFSSPVSFVIAFGLFLVFFYIFRSVFNLLYFYLLSRFSQGRYHLIAYKLFEKYLGMHYVDFVNKNSSHFIKTIVNEAQNLVQLISNILFMMSEIFVVIFIYSMLVYVNWKMTLLLTTFLGINVFILKTFVSTKIKKAGEIRNEMQQRFYEIMTSSFGNFKIIKLKGNDKDILKKFSEASYGFAKVNILNQTLVQVPRLFLEAIGFGLISLIVVYLVYKYKSDIKAALPILSMFVLGLYRLMPSVNRIYTSYNQVLFYLKSLDITHADLLYEPEALKDEKIEFGREIKLKDVWFEYQKNKPVLKGINLTIKKGEKIGVMGKSGSGKSTLVDLIIGLYKPAKGEILVDNRKLSEKNVKSWRKKIGYIPQTIYLFDGTVAENVAFGEEIDEEKVRKVLDMANILDFLEKNHNGIYTRVGENGVMLSGGQKQRVAIARALYGDPEILVLDEATSSLDSQTEAKIMDEIYRIGKSKTMIIVAHRTSTLDRCDRIVEVRNGEIKRCVELQAG
ncbi:ABC transporter ATP-binding protein/permease [Hippea sp. KM1]|uniref:ABC transporter ATP-binding protein/permease n=1 Tax=Hippea sp. KM1 TaxID=944481 RepID=UPI0004AD439B|nr:ABC transporter ATP-binding protein [Hippea sp. KM1]